MPNHALSHLLLFKTRLSYICYGTILYDCVYYSAHGNRKVHKKAYLFRLLYTVEKIVEIKLNTQEQVLFNNSVDAVKKLIAEIKL